MGFMFQEISCRMFILCSTVDLKFSCNYHYCHYSCNYSLITNGLFFVHYLVRYTGPFDVVLGHSQGACMLVAMDSLKSQPGMRDINPATNH